MRRFRDPSAPAPSALGVGDLFPDGLTVVIARQENDGGLNVDAIVSPDCRPIGRLIRDQNRSFLLAACHRINGDEGRTTIPIMRRALELEAQLILLAAAPWEDWREMRSRTSGYQPAGTYHTLPSPELAQLLGVLDAGVELAADCLRNGLCLVRHDRVARLWAAGDTETPHDLDALT